MIILSSCSKNKACPDSQKATIVDRTGLDGCSFMIELNDGTMLEPTNLSEFGIKKEDGLKVWIDYSETKNGFSICMAGTMVDIDCISKR